MQFMTTNYLKLQVPLYSRLILGSRGLLHFTGDDWRSCWEATHRSQSERPGSDRHATVARQGHRQDGSLHEGTHQGAHQQSQGVSMVPYFF